MKKDEIIKLATEIIENKNGEVISIDESKLYIEYKCQYGHPRIEMRPKFVLDGEWCTICDKEKRRKH
ncbi:hypothetical protein CN918_25790 [Priestia megaterium]|nr:hypothetical protein CN918_25790 [Priestia megaterium]